MNIRPDIKIQIIDTFKIRHQAKLQNYTNIFYVVLTYILLTYVERVWRICYVVHVDLFIIIFMLLLYLCSVLILYICHIFEIIFLLLRSFYVKSCSFLYKLKS